jgi:hypothetical protein
LEYKILKTPQNSKLMKKSLFMLTFALVAMLGFQTVNAQSLASYTAGFNPTTGTLTVSGKVGGFGKSTRSMDVELFIEVESSVDCYKYTGGPTPQYQENTFTKFSEAMRGIVVSGKGFGNFTDLSVTADGTLASCSGAWNFLAGGDAEVIRAWIVITGYDVNGVLVKQSEEIEIVW